MLLSPKTSCFYLAEIIKLKTISLQILGYADHVFTGLFTIEIILKVVFAVYNAVPSIWIFCILLKLGEVIVSVHFSILSYIRLIQYLWPPTDDCLWSIPPQRFLLQKLFQYSGPGSGQRVPHLLRNTVSEVKCFCPACWGLICALLWHVYPALCTDIY